MSFFDIVVGFTRFICVICEILSRKKHLCQEDCGLRPEKIFCLFGVEAVFFDFVEFLEAGIEGFKRWGFARCVRRLGSGRSGGW